MADHALQTARSLLVTAGKAGPGSREHRDFFSHLITLPTYRDSRCTQFFSTLVSKYFSEFEDLQDRAVDAVLDLCEDENEQTRILGIKGLGATAKADPRWVRGNAGVLLQLLECPERELREVKTVLNSLLAQSPIPVLSVMADDCKGSEEETGASRRNILEYLFKDCAEFRRTTLESGKNLAAEQTFRAGFTDVLKQTAISETRMVLEMLIPLSTISGPSANVEATNAFVKALTDSLKADSSTSATTGHIHLLAVLAKRINLSPRSALYFFGKHGGAVVESILEKKDEEALALVKALRVWADEAIKEWKKEDTVRDDGLVRDCVLAMIEELLDCVEDISTSKLESMSPVLGHILLPLYTLIRYRDRRNDIINSRKSKDIAALAHKANKAAKDHHRRTIEGRCLRNIRDMAEILSDYDMAFEDIETSWTPRHSSPPPRPSIPTSKAPAGSRSTAPSGPRSTVPPASAASSSRTPAPTSTQSTSTSRAPTGPRATSPIRPTPSASRVQADVIDLTTGSAFDRPGTDKPGSTRAPRSVTERGGQFTARDTVQSPERAKRITTPPREAATSRVTPPDTPRIPTPPPSRRQGPIGNSSGLPMKGKDDEASAQIGGTSSRGLELLGPASRSQAMPNGGSSRGVELLLKPAPAPSLSASSPATTKTYDGSSTSAQPIATTSSLISRLSPAIPADRGISIKRQREETSDLAPGPDPKPAQINISSSISTPTVSLASRLGGRDEPSDSKRSRLSNGGNADSSVASKMSLFDRINGTSSSAPSTPANQQPPTAVQAGLSIRNRGSTAVQTPDPVPGITIRRSLPVSTSTSTIPAQVPPRLSVLGRSTSNTPAPAPGLSIVGRSTSSSAPTLKAAVPAVEDEGPIRRKGRGFQTEDHPMEDAFSQRGFDQLAFTRPPTAPPIPVFAPTPMLSQTPIAIMGRSVVPDRKVQPFRPTPKPPSQAEPRGSLQSRIGPRG